MPSRYLSVKVIMLGTAIAEMMTTTATLPIVSMSETPLSMRHGRLRFMFETIKIVRKTTGAIASAMPCRA